MRTSDRNGASEITIKRPDSSSSSRPHVNEFTKATPLTGRLENWTFYGSGSSMGEKAQQLFDKTSIMEEAGFVTNPRVVL